jgi:hypothetical protein
MTAALALFAVTVVATVVGTVLALEAQAWAPYVSRHLVRLAVARLQADMPRQLRERWVEEIEADAASFADRPLGGLVFSLRLWRKGGRELAGELALREAPAPESQTASPPPTESIWIRNPRDGRLVKYTIHLDSSAIQTWNEMRQSLGAMEKSEPDE